VLLTELKKADLGCFIGTWFATALAYADDLILIAPSARAMQAMLANCNKFATEYCAMFNITKSNSIARKQVVMPPHHCRILQLAVT